MSSVLDILMVTGQVAGGVGRHVEQLSTGLVAVGQRVTIACPSTVAARFDLAATGAAVVPVPIGARPSPHRDRASIAALRKAMSRAQVVHAHGLRAGSLALAARRGGEPPVVVTSHNAPPEGRLASVVYRGLERLVARDADVVLAVSPDLLERARRRGARATALAVVPASYSPARRTSQEVRDELRTPPGALLVVAVGRLAPQKGFDRLLDAMAELSADGSGDAPAVQLVVAGEGPQEAALLRQISRHSLPVQLLGHRDDVPDLLGAADLVVSAARWEGQPVWLQEALCAGAPVLATDVGGTAAVVGDAACLVSPDASRLAEELSELLEDPAAREHLAARSRARCAALPGSDEAVRAAVTAYACAAAAIAES